MDSLVNFWNTLPPEKTSIRDVKKLDNSNSSYFFLAHRTVGIISFL